MAKRLGLIALAALAAASGPALSQAQRLPEAERLFLEVFMNGCLNPIANRENPVAAILENFVIYEPVGEGVGPLDAAFPEHRMWQMPARRGLVEIELGRRSDPAACTVRLYGGDARKTYDGVLAHLRKVGVPFNREDVTTTVRGERTRRLLLEQDPTYNVSILATEVTRPGRDQPGLVLTTSLAPISQSGN